MPVVRRLSECEGFDSEVAECLAQAQPKEFHDSVPKFITIKPTPIRPDPPFQWDCSSEEDTQPSKERELRVQLMASLAEVDTLRSDLQGARFCSRCLDLNNLHLQTQVGQLSDEIAFLQEQVQRLLEEVDILKGIGQRAHSGEGEGVGLAHRPVFLQTISTGRTDQTQNGMSNGQDKLFSKAQFSQSNLPSRKDLSTSSVHVIENNNEKHNVQKSVSFFSGLSKMFGRHGS
ncbi:uncharacterized protein [Haliotis asinina]|uniref:uncharacterized protein n=1 Tax=Haliotis asinina TaxID=109174 RepID=UPI003532595F